MSGMIILASAIALALLIYLIAVLVHPEGGS